MEKLTIVIEVLLVAFLASNVVLEGLGFLDLLLDGDNPAIAVAGSGSLKLVGLALQIEGEAENTLLGNIGSLSLRHG